MSRTNSIHTNETPHETLNGEIWGISTYFNPAGYSNKVNHLQIFCDRVRKQGLKLLVVELTFENMPFTLGEEVADIVVRVKSSSLLWQKERLLNIALEELPKQCDKVVWLDADIIFDNDKWVEQTAEHLKQYVVVQPFKVAWWLSAACTQALYRKKSKISKIAMRQWRKSSERSDFSAIYAQLKSVHRSILSGHPGFACAARRNLLEKHGLYDRFILGGADVAVSLAILGYDERSISNLIARYCTPSQAADLLSWIRSFSSDIENNIFYTTGAVYHLWHGSQEDRKYEQRMRILLDHDFNPLVDIALDDNRCWRWNSEKPNLHQEVKGYFWSRAEEGT
jgi:hypothetical protein